MTYKQAQMAYKKMVTTRLNILVTRYGTAKNLAVASHTTESTICRILHGNYTKIPKQTMLRLFGEDLTEVELPNSTKEDEIKQIKADIDVLQKRLKSLES